MSHRGENRKNALSYEAIMRALFETYESIYDIDAQTSAYQCYHESDSYSGLSIAGSGPDFFTEVREHIPQMIHPDDRAYVSRCLSRDVLLRTLEAEKHYSFVYRLLRGGQPVYHKIRATLRAVGGRPHILLGVRDVDETIRQEKAHTSALTSLHQKQQQYLEAILASASICMEVNLTKDLLLEHSPIGALLLPQTGGAALSAYSAVHRWLCENRITENREGYGRIGSREYLLACFARGERRASVSFSIRSGGVERPCRALIYLYRDGPSGDVMAFCVIYDLTEQQRREKEMQELSHALQMSRIRNFTGQMQPHFLYNALASIQEIVLEDPAYASELLGDFTVHLRSCIRAMTGDTLLPFSQEMDNIRAYVNIERMRFGDKLRVVYDVPVADFRILPLSVQPLVENAIRHGVYQRGPQGGTVTVRTRELPDAWRVEVEDDGVGFDVAALERELAAGTRDAAGLKNIMFRLDRVMHARVEVRSTPNVGTAVTITIPKGGTADESDHRG